MKKGKLFFVLSIAVLISFTACKKSETLSVKAIDGTYVGTITIEDGLKSVSSDISATTDAIAEVSDIGNGEIEIHCYSEELDTTFILNHYQHNDSVMVCLNGEAFEEMYGHSMGHGEMMGGTNHGNSDWMNHMNTEHGEGDEHFGGFNMTTQKFDFTIKREAVDYRFQGSKR